MNMMVLLIIANLLRLEHIFINVYLDIIIILVLKIRIVKSGYMMNFSVNIFLICAKINRILVVFAIKKKLKMIVLQLQTILVVGFLINVYKYPLHLIYLVIN